MGASNSIDTDERVDDKIMRLADEVAGNVEKFPPPWSNKKDLEEQKEMIAIVRYVTGFHKADKMYNNMKNKDPCRPTRDAMQVRKFRGFLEEGFLEGGYNSILRKACFMWSGALDSSHILLHIS